MRDDDQSHVLLICIYWRISHHRLSVYIQIYIHFCRAGQPHNWLPFSSFANAFSFVAEYTTETWELCWTSTSERRGIVKQYNDVVQHPKCKTMILVYYTYCISIYPKDFLNVTIYFPAKNEHRKVSTEKNYTYTYIYVYTQRRTDFFRLQLFLMFY